MVVDADAAQVLEKGEHGTHRTADAPFYIEFSISTFRGGVRSYGRGFSSNEAKEVNTD
jgi:hypothetical protein